MNPALDSKVQTAMRPDATWVTILDCAAKEVFQIMLHTDLSSVSNPNGELATGDTTAMVGLAGALCGVLSIRCGGRTAESIAGRMLGTIGEVNPSEIPDAMGEICNMVAGNFKAKITLLADHCMLSVPTVIRGDDYEMVTMTDSEQISLCLHYDKAPIWFTLAVHS